MVLITLGTELIGTALSKVKRFALGSIPQSLSAPDALYRHHHTFKSIATVIPSIAHINLPFLLYTTLNNNPLSST